MHICFQSVSSLDTPHQHALFSAEVIHISMLSSVLKSPIDVFNWCSGINAAAAGSQALGHWPTACTQPAPNLSKSL